jgi:hypothetical protein
MPSVSVFAFLLSTPICAFNALCAQVGSREDLLLRVKCHELYQNVEIDGVGLFELDGKALAKACLVRGLSCLSGLLIPESVARNLQDQTSYQADVDQARMLLGEFCTRENVPQASALKTSTSAGASGSLHTTHEQCRPYILRH